MCAGAIALIMGVLWAITGQAQTPKRIALVGGMLLDGWEVPPLHHAAVLIEGNRIVQVGPAAEVKIPPDATVIDTSGQTMMPESLQPWIWVLP
jgi:imidazolonepropionase-like amidohydrolase